MAGFWTGADWETGEGVALRRALSPRAGPHAGPSLVALARLPEDAEGAADRARAEIEEEEDERVRRFGAKWCLIAQASAVGFFAAWLAWIWCMR